PGFSDISQEAGHAHIEKNGRKCLCGARGCFNAYVSGTGAAQMAKEMGMKGDVTAKQVYAQNNKISKKVFEIQKYYIATQLAHISLHHRPQLIELFGGLTNQRKLFDSAIKDLRENPIKYAYPGFKAPLIKITKLGDNIGLFGAAAMALR
ncbi:MAG: ROK family protein, partial [Nanoarchaeota archaeon]|nr:ROK family protein [Nanoarchaeota archaeon]